jgi:SulP family sulfate permease
VLAGLAVASLLIPQSLAYAELAGVPAYCGLYASMLPPIAAAFFASSPYLQTGPVAMTALLTFGALSTLAAPRGAEYTASATLLALVVGAVRVLIGMLRGGWVAYLMPQPVVTGFTSATALLIIASQTPTAVGTEGTGADVIGSAWAALRDVASWQPAAIGLGALTIAFVMGGRRLHPLFPGVLVAVVSGVAIASHGGYPGPVVGEIPQGLPPFSLDLPWTRVPELLLPGLVIALVGFAEPAAIARIYAAQDRQRWSPNRELVAQGIANLASGLSGGFPVGGSFSRTSVNRLAGGRTQWSGAITGLVVLLFLPMAGVLSTLPRAVLGAIVIAAVWPLLSFRPLWRLLRVAPVQGGVGWVTFALTLALAPRVDRAVLMGIGLAIAVHFWRELTVQVDADYADGTLRLSPRGVLFFASAPGLEAALLEQLSAHPAATRLVLQLAHLGRIDYTGALALKSVVQEATDAGLTVRMEGAPSQTRRILQSVFGPDPDLVG